MNKMNLDSYFPKKPLERESLLETEDTQKIPLHVKTAKMLQVCRVGYKTVVEVTASSAHDDSKEGFSDFSENSKMARTCKKVVSGDLGASTSVVTCWTHLISWAQLTLLAMYSARQLLRFTVGCFLLFHDMEPPNPLTDFLLST